MKKTDASKPIVKGDKKVIRGWILYDWANSVYQLTITTAIFPIYFLAVTQKGPDDFYVNFFGNDIINSVLYSWAIATAYLVVAGLTPLLSSLADYTGRRKAFMQVFTVIGALSCGALYFFDKDHITIGVIAFTLATVGYGGSLVYYNSFLPVIAEEKDQDRISAQGYSMGYLGGIVLIIFNLLMIEKPELFGITDDTLPAKISFLSVCVWWLAFAQVTFNRLPKYTYRKRRKDKESNILIEGYSELNKVFKEVIKSKKFTFYLIGFFFVMMGLITTMFMSVTFGKKEVGLDDNILIPVLLIIQLVGMGGAWLFARISSRIGNLKSLIISVAIWVAVCTSASQIVNATQFIVAAFFIGLVMGGTQSLARSTYSKMIPETSTDHTSYFSFYDVMEKLATVAGTFSWGLIEAITGNMRYSVISIGLFFVVGIIFLGLTLYSEFIAGKQSRKTAPVIVKNP
ncbi:MAG TPA: MFS transporter [Lentimicrobium sp.]|nr:MFS transporter [Lentimicrobium sp.]